MNWDFTVWSLPVGVVGSCALISLGLSESFTLFSRSPPRRLHHMRLGNLSKYLAKLKTQTYDIFLVADASFCPLNSSGGRVIKTTRNYRSLARYQKHLATLEE